MPAVKTSREDAVAAIAGAFRQFGYDGASLSRLSAATGLGRSSLYHYFPNGKEDMAAAAVEHISAEAARMVLAPLQETGDPAKRVRAAASGLAKFYDGGRANCLVNLFSVGDAADAAPGAARAMAGALETTFERVAVEAGAAAKEARLRAEQAIVEIEGSLVVSRAAGANAPFQRALARLPEILTGA